MSPLKRTKSQRKLEHEPTNIDKLAALLEQPSPFTSRSSSRRRSSHPHEERKGESRSKSAGRMKSSRSSPRSRFQDSKSKSAPALPSSTGDEYFPTRRPHSRQAKNGKDEFSLSLDKITLKIGSVTYEMDDLGRWSTPTNSFTLKEEAAQLHASNTKLFEENNLLRVKNELLLDMITNKSLRITQVEDDLQRLRKIVSSSSNRFSEP